MINDIKTDAQTRMGKSIDSLKHDLTRIRTGRASTALVDNIKVSYYGADMPLTQVASVNPRRCTHDSHHAMGKADGGTD